MKLFVISYRIQFRIPILAVIRLAVLRMVASALFLVSFQSFAQDISVPVTVTIQEVHALEDFEGGGNADWYAVVTIDGHEVSNEDTPETDSVENDDDIFVNWQFTRNIDLAKGSINVMIEIRDEDGFLRLGDDLADVDPEDGPVFVDFTVALSPCTVSGEVNGGCGQTFVSAGNTAHDDADGAASVHFKVDVIEPVVQAGVLVRCTHHPIWPQPGEMVELMVESLDGALDPRISDSVELWFDNSLEESAAGRTRLTTQVMPASDSFAYGCRINETPLFPGEEDPQVFSGWRRVSVGIPADGRAIPVLFNEDRIGAVDILLVPDQDNYSGAADPAFIEDAELSSFDPDYGYYSEKILLERQDLFNIWLALDTADAEPFDSNNDCPHIAPANYDTDYLFADSLIILHTDDFRDCAKGSQNLASSEPPDITMRRTIVHETGHRPFGLSDEYCHKRPGSMGMNCDGAYWEASMFPNVFESQGSCETSALMSGRQISDCQSWLSDRPMEPDPYYTHDPSAVDLMVDNEQAELLDRERINWFLDQCDINDGC